MDKVQKSSTIGRNNGGRKKGIPNKKSLDVEQRLIELGVDIVEGLVAFYKGDYKFLKLPELIVKPGFQGVETYELSIPASLRLEALKTLAKYRYPTRKAVEHKIDEESSKSFSLAYTAESLKND